MNYFVNYSYQLHNSNNGQGHICITSDHPISTGADIDELCDMIKPQITLSDSDQHLRDDLIVIINNFIVLDVEEDTNQELIDKIKAVVTNWDTENDSSTWDSMDWIKDILVGEETNDPRELL